MEYLFNKRKGLKRSLSGKYFMLFLDYDGTLTPIVDTPELAVLSDEARQLLKVLSQNQRIRLAVISGRSLENIKSVVGIKDVIYAGNHGLEVQGPKIKFKSQVSLRLRSVIRKILKEITKRLLGFKGVLVEDKGLTISVHYRKIKISDIPLIDKIISDITAPYLASKEIRINQGKKVYEIKPFVMWDKGKVVLWLLARQQFVVGQDKIIPIYIGDDFTDEDAFKALSKNGLTIFVGESRVSAAKYYLKDPVEVLEFLRYLLDLTKI